MSLNKERLQEISDYDLKSGSGKDLKTACIMQMVSYIAGEQWTDHPECACPILTRYAICLNDRFKDKHRQLLKPFIPLLVDTKLSDAVQIKRKKLIIWRNVTATYPIILDLLKLTDIANNLRSIPNSIDGMSSAKKILIDNHEIIKKTYYPYATAAADADAYAYAAAADAYANANADTYADADAYAYAAAAYAYADAYAYANAYAYAYANADALRENLSEVAIATLRLAIEIKE